MNYTGCIATPRPLADDFDLTDEFYQYPHPIDRVVNSPPPTLVVAQFVILPGRADMLDDVGMTCQPAYTAQNPFFLPVPLFLASVDIEIDIFKTKRPWVRISICSASSCVQVVFADDQEFDNHQPDTDVRWRNWSKIALQI
jgi:hypothetical protein